MINFDFFLTNNLGFPHGMSVKFACGRFMNFQNDRKKFSVVVENKASFKLLQYHLQHLGNSVT